MGCCNTNVKQAALLDDKVLLKSALKALGKENLALIAHGSSFPSDKDMDTGFGNPNSKAAKCLIDFVSGVFDSIQLGPSGKTKFIDSSPYTGTVFSNNTLFIDLESLTTDKWDKILSMDTLKKIVKDNPNKNTGKTAYSYIFEAQNNALKEAFENFKKSQKLNDLKQEFIKFKADNKFWLEKDSLYEALIIEHNNDYWPLWDSELDKNLFNPQNDEDKKFTNARIEELKKKYSDVIDFYEFSQFVIFKQNEETKNYASERGIKMIADRQVAFSDRDTWAYKSCFLDGWCLGCPPDYFSKDGQTWGFPVIDPDKLFNKDMSLAEGGIFLKKLYSKMFKENPGGVRIDHIVGLIDPWVYKPGKTAKVEDGAGRLYSSPEHSELYKYAIAKYEDLDLSLEPDKEKRVARLNDEQIKRYGALIEKIVIASAEENGLTKDAIVCEDLGTLTNPVAAVMEKYGLMGMKLTQFTVPTKPDDPYRFKNITKDSWAMVGTHDNEPILTWAKKMVNTEDGKLHAQNLTEDLWPDANDICKSAVCEKLFPDHYFLASTKLVEIFASKAKNIQIFFTDFFGIEDVYNKPGTSGDQNWSLRIPNNFEEVYKENLNKNKGLNLHLILKLAMEARGAIFAQTYADLIKKF